jgi:hypothetical protein
VEDVGHAAGAERLPELVAAAEQPGRQRRGHFLPFALSLAGLAARLSAAGAGAGAGGGAHRYGRRGRRRRRWRGRRFGTTCIHDGAAHDELTGRLHAADRIPDRTALLPS